MLPSILMQLDFAASAVDAEPPAPGGGVNDLLLLGVGRMVIFGYPIAKVLQWLSSLLANRA